ncbi:MAG: amino acid transporter [Acidobacteria bacterium]|nr:MAG: amino acid transporter [Acidobacteriota bacterium]
MASPPRPRLLRVVGLPGLTAIAVNGVIGSGIFVLPATVAGLLGPASPVAYLVAALVAALVVACFAEAGSLFDRTGGPYLYARKAFGPFVAFQVGWAFFLSRLAAAAAIGNAFAAYLGYLWPAAAGGAGRALAITALLAALAAVNVVGVRYGGWTVNVLTVAKLVPLLLFVSVGLVYADPNRYVLLALPDSSRLRQASLLLIFAFGGFENASVPGDESKDPKRHLPVALLAAIGLTAVLYVLVQIVALGTLPGLASDPTPLASAARSFLGPAGALAIALGAVVSTAGSSSALALVGPRILYALAEGGQLPAALARVHERHRTPHVAVVVFTLLAWAAALLGDFARLAAVSAVARLVFSAATCLAVPVLRRKMPAAERRFRVPGGLLVPAAAAGLSLWLLTGLERSQAATGVAALVAGFFLYLALGRVRYNRPT